MFIYGHSSESNMTRDDIRELAIESGFTLRDQPDGTRDLNPYVYTFALKVSAVTIRELNEDRRDERPRPLSEWNDDTGPVLWWKFPIEEPPYVGSPLCDDWPGYHTHWTPVFMPRDPIDMNIDYIRQTYGVPAQIGGRVQYQPEIPGARPWQGTIMAAEGAYLRIRRDGDEETYPAPFHPEWNLTYFHDDAIN
jgi:hypothetical protein